MINTTNLSGEPGQAQLHLWCGSSELKEFVRCGVERSQCGKELTEPHSGGTFDGLHKFVQPLFVGLASKDRQNDGVFEGETNIDDRSIGKSNVERSENEPRLATGHHPP